MEESFVEELNRLYFTDSERYMKRLAAIKDAGYKVFRNSTGQHKVEFDFSNAFGGIFGEIFRGSSK